MSDTPIFDQLASQRMYDRLVSDTQPDFGLVGSFFARPSMSVTVEKAYGPNLFLDGPLERFAPQEEVLVRPFKTIAGVPRGVMPSGMTDIMHIAAPSPTGSELFNSVAGKAAAAILLGESEDEDYVTMSAEEMAEPDVVHVKALSEVFKALQHPPTDYLKKTFQEEFTEFMYPYEVPSYSDLTDTHRVTVGKEFCPLDDGADFHLFCRKMMDGFISDHPHAGNIHVSVTELFTGSTVFTIEGDEPNDIPVEKRTDEAPEEPEIAVHDTRPFPGVRMWKDAGRVLTADDSDLVEIGATAEVPYFRGTQQE